MMLPRAANQLLLPVKPLFVALTLLLALGVNLLPLGRHPAQPDLLALVLVFWNVHHPRRADRALPGRALPCQFPHRAPRHGVGALLPSAGSACAAAGARAGGRAAGYLEVMERLSSPPA